MAEIVNLRMARKRKAHADKDAQAEQNRLSFGRTKADKQKSAAEKALVDRHVDSHKRED